MELDPQIGVAALTIRSSSFARKENLEAALADANRMIELAPDNPAAFQARFGFMNRLKRYPEAAEDIRKFVELTPNDSLLHLDYAYALSRIEDYEGARRELKEAEERGNRSAWFYNNLAWVLSTADDDNIRDGARAEEAIREARELMPNESSILDPQAAVSAELGRFDEAVKRQKQFLASKTLTAERRKGGETRLSLYQQHKPYRQKPGD